MTRQLSPEASQLFEFIQSISGQKTLTGQHAAPLVSPTQLVVAERQIGHYPALFGQDFGFDFPGSWDGINFRQQIVDEAIRRHHEGFVITLMWHAVRPTEDEPVTFSESIQGKVTDEEWREITTPGTHLHERWKSQVDVVAWFLKQLRHAKVPVIWRPYHEMNGNWFWWGQRRGEDGYKKLYRQLFERLTHFHGLDNLIWVYNANEVRNETVQPYEWFYPGEDVVDILATDIYSGSYAQDDYESLLALAGDKPIALGEVGSAPSLEILEKQPRWTWFMAWGNPFDFGPSEPERLKQIRATYDGERTLNREELPWVKMPKPSVHYPVLK